MQLLRSHIAGKGDIQALWIAEAVECRILQLILDKLVERGRTRDQIAESLRHFLANIQRYTKFVKDTDKMADLSKSLSAVLQLMKPEFFGIAGAGAMEVVTRKVVNDVMAGPIEYSVVHKVHDQDIAVVFCLEGPDYRPPKPSKPAKARRGRPPKRSKR